MESYKTARHYKMYKSGKSWMVMGITTVALLMGSSASVLADRQTAPTTTTMSQNVSADKETNDLDLKPSATTKPTTDVSVNQDESATSSVGSQPATSQAVTDNQASEAPVDHEQSPSKPTSDAPVTDATTVAPATDENDAAASAPANEAPKPDDSVATAPATDDSATSAPTADKPATSSPANETPASPDSAPADTTGEATSPDYQQSVTDEPVPDDQAASDAANQDQAPASTPGQQTDATDDSAPSTEVTPPTEAPTSQVSADETTVTPAPDTVVTPTTTTDSVPTVADPMTANTDLMTKPATVPELMTQPEPAVVASAMQGSVADLHLTAAQLKKPQKAAIDINSWMPDKNFQIVTLWIINNRLHLNLTNVNQITQELMGKLTVFFASNGQLKKSREYYDALMNTVSLQGLEYATNLEEIWYTTDLDANFQWQGKFIIHGKLKDISALKGLTKLREVNVQMNAVEDVSALAGKNLTLLSVSYNQISDLTPVASSLATLPPHSTLAYQQIVLKDIVQLHVDPNTGKFVTTSIAFGKDHNQHLAIKPLASADAVGVNLDETTIEWTAFKQQGFLKYEWHDPWMGAAGYPFDGTVYIPFQVTNDQTQGSLQVAFVDEAGQHLATDIMLNHELNASYDVAKDPQVLTTLSQLKGRHYGIKEVHGNPNWVPGKDLAQLTYVLAPIQPSVTFQAVDDQGKPLPDVTVPVQTGNFDETWQLTVPNVPGYDFVQATEGDQVLTLTDGKLTGQYVGEQTIQLVYSAKTQHATVHFEYEDGTSAGATVTLSGKHGDQIQFPAAPELAGYYADELPTAYYQDGDNNYTVIYRKAGQVTVQYVDRDGAIIATGETLTGKVGSGYTTAAKVVAGYSLLVKPTNADGQFTKEPTTVIYQYLKDPAASVLGKPLTVTYVDENGQTLRPAETLTGQVGESYAVNIPVITGYELLHVNGQTDGVYTDQAQTLQFVFRKEAAKQGQVTVHYVDNHGQNIAPATVLTGEIGSAYHAEALTIPGYHLVQTTGQASGTFAATGEVTFVYEPVPTVVDPGNPEPGTPEPGNPEPGTPEPGNPEPGNPEPGNPEPGKPEPGKPEPGNPEPGKPEPGQPAPGNPEPGNPEPGKPEPGNPEPGTPEPGNPEPGNPAPGHPEPGNPEPDNPASSNPDTVNPAPVQPDTNKPDTSSSTSVAADTLTPDQSETDSASTESTLVAGDTLAPNWHSHVHTTTPATMTTVQAEPQVSHATASATVTTKPVADHPADLATLSPQTTGQLPQTDDQRGGWLQALGLFLFGLVAFVSGRKRD